MFGFLFLVTPATIIALNDFGELHSLGNMPWLAVILNFAWYGAIAIGLRTLCLHNAAWLLGRNEGQPHRTGNIHPSRKIVGEQATVAARP